MIRTVFCCSMIWSLFEEKILKLFDKAGKNRDTRTADLLLDRVLAPSFRIFAGLEDRISMFHRESRRVLTEEQERILDETELNPRMLFLGSAGSGKTFVAMEKARRLAEEGKRVFLTCYNRNLAREEFARLSDILTTSNFHDYLKGVLTRQGFCLEKPQTPEEERIYYDETLPVMGFDYFSSLPDSEKFEGIIVDEGQDFKEPWLTCLESMLTPGGVFYMFADPNQDLFGANLDLMKLPVSKQRLTRNLRNTEYINDWLNELVPDARLKSLIKGGMPVRTFAWDTPAMERKQIEDEVGRLVSQGISPKRILILSPNRYEKSSLCGMEKIKEWPLARPGENKPGAIRFNTIRSYKGLEADIVFLIGIKPGTFACTNTDVYVGASRARFLLYIFHHKDWKLPMA